MGNSKRKNSDIQRDTAHSSTQFVTLRVYRADRAKLKEIGASKDQIIAETVNEVVDFYVENNKKN